MSPLSRIPSDQYFMIRTKEHNQKIGEAHIRKGIGKSPFKVCPRCEKTLPRKNFERRSKQNLFGEKLSKSYCLPCDRSYAADRQRKFIENHPEKKEYRRQINRKCQYKKKYGITPEEYDKILLIQREVCAICKKKGRRELCVDHCHTTGKIRGLLCDGCNRGLGFLNDDIKLLKSAIIYLQT